MELALIRWLGTQVRVFAYFNNLVLIATFLGMGLGIALGRRKPGLVHWVLPALALLAVPVGFSEALGIVAMPFPDDSVALWGSSNAGDSGWRFSLTLAIFLALFCLVVLVFVFAGAPLGFLFGELRPLRAYSWDLSGSLLGIVVFSASTFLNASPPVWLALGGLPFLWLSRRVSSLATLTIAVSCGWFSVGDALYSPYNRIDLEKGEQSIVLSVNRDFHQYMYDFSDDAVNRTEQT